MEKQPEEAAVEQELGQTDGQTTRAERAKEGTGKTKTQRARRRKKKDDPLNGDDMNKLALDEHLSPAYGTASRSFEYQRSRAAELMQDTMKEMRARLSDAFPPSLWTGEQGPLHSSTPFFRFSPH